jgi:hypothetical protein
VAWLTSAGVLVVGSVTSAGEVSDRVRIKPDGDEHKFRPPLVLDGHYLYFNDAVPSGVGSKYVIARVPVPFTQPVRLQRYSPGGEAKLVQNRPSFGVTSSHLYVARYPQSNSQNANATIVRDELRFSPTPVVFDVQPPGP